MADRLVTLAMPVRNGMPYLDESLSALQDQTHENLEIIICDNASRDGTEELCRERAATDQRIRYHRFEDDAGAIVNFSRAFALGQGPFFSWAAHDDRFDRSYVGRCLEELDRSPGAIGCLTGIRFIDESGTPLATYRNDHGMADPAAPERLAAHVRRFSGWYGMYGLYRRGALAGRRLFADTYGFDVVFIWELLLRGPVEVIDDLLFNYRVFRSKTPVEVDSTLHSAADGSALRFVHMRVFQLMWSVAASPDLPAATTDAARDVLRNWVGGKSFRDALIDDLHIEMRRARGRRQWPAVALSAAAMALLGPTRTARWVTHGRRMTPPGSEAAR